MLSEMIDPVNIPCKYGGRLDFEFGMLPDLDLQIKDEVDWENRDGAYMAEDLPQGPMRWIRHEDGRRTAIAVGTMKGEQRKAAVMTTRV
jgi:hypothetical protein